MEVKIISIKQVTTQDGTILNQLFCLLEDNSIGNCYTTKSVKVGDKITLTISIDKNCKFCVRPIINNN